jgi:restriction system protein
MNDDWYKNCELCNTDLTGATPFKINLVSKRKSRSSEWERQRRQEKSDYIDSKKEAAREEIEMEKEEREYLSEILANREELDFEYIWKKREDNTRFNDPRPEEPRKDKYPPEIDKTSFRYFTNISLLDKIFQSRKREKIKKVDNLYITDCERRQEKIAEIESSYEEQMDIYKQELSQWRERKDKFFDQRRQRNAQLEELKTNFLSKKKDAVEKFCLFVLSESRYFYSEIDEYTHEIEYNDKNGLLVVNYVLPTIEKMPTLKSVRYVATRDEIVKNYLPDSQVRKLYDNVIYQIVLRTLFELFSLDMSDSIKIINLNGYVNTIDKATGKHISPCILSINVKKDEFLDLNLDLVEPQVCFKSLKGISASKLSAITPVAPIIKFNKTDSRFIESYDITGEIDDSVNLAMINWQDFEHLIRELFEKEFKSNGGEVKVTQASRDGGVDAIAFDPDPIRGGKIVIQAKRYTNTVGVSAVRDLYGTVMNEGATKGILVTTSDYGPDAYSFANGKPLTLLNGGNLLSLLEKFGHKAKIDIKEAKIALKEQ